MAIEIYLAINILMYTWELLEEKLGGFIDHSYIWDDNETVVTGKRSIGSVKDLKIQLYPHDHNPPHFHVISKSRNIDARFSIYPEIGFWNNKGHKSIKQDDIKKIIQYFKINTSAKKLLYEEAERFKKSII